MNRKKELLSSASDLTTAGVFTGILSYITKLPPGIDNILSMALPALACSSNAVLRLQNEKVLNKDKQKVEALARDLQLVMNERKINELKHFTSLDFPIEIYSVIEEIIKEAVNAKGTWLRKLASHILVTIGSDDEPTHLEGKRLCLDLIKELNETDVKLLLLFQAKSRLLFDKYCDEEKLKLEFKKVLNELLNDEGVYAQTILSSSIKLSNLGLISRDCGMTPYDDEFGNKDAMIRDFLVQNQNNVTAHFTVFRKYLYTFV
ncbi:hypothetical protein CSV71_08080 [Sporosarcina sp. P21c]|uniref:hypothetical protein n=1 Tax=unclassified Sporosarcina TaxID=2647733 RepID=UPI000C16E457|nr:MULTISPECIES: hypothetical protein [unclassified Sporosarcina]PIC66761.1 hypothetical protein CSV78_11300 [Sporosarcina sp. P16a]PIC89896.1 hypothetical protein CSV71_08080 [Sporosarcina sp. P21c]PIC93282.1 hypothetical protein CSV70_06895 [Sporosarcina sp. P25]